MSDKVILTVKKENLVNWYFADWSRNDYSSCVAQIKRELKINGKITFSIEGLVDSLGYIPSHILEGEHSVDEYETWDELKII